MGYSVADITLMYIYVHFVNVYIQEDAYNFYKQK